MLDWVNIDEQKPVLAHELTHALQDQHSDLEKWNDQTPDDVSTNSAGDTDHLAKDELDTARDAVAEGQATAVMMDYILKPMGKSLVKDPEVMDFVKQQMAGSDSSPVLARAPLLLSESLLFPYREGLSFEQDVWMDKGRAAAFAGALDRPPTSTWEIINPREYEKQAHSPPFRCCPTFIPSSTSFTSPTTSARSASSICTFSPSSSAATRPPATSPPPGMAASTGPASSSPPKLPPSRPAPNLSLSSISPPGRTPHPRRTSPSLYADSLGRKYSGLKPDLAAQRANLANLSSGTTEQVFTTNEGPVVITTRGKLVFVAESFRSRPSPQAHHPHPRRPRLRRTENGQQLPPR